MTESTAITPRSALRRAGLLSMIAAAAGLAVLMTRPPAAPPVLIAKVMRRSRNAGPIRAWSIVIACVAGGLMPLISMTLLSHVGDRTSWSSELLCHATTFAFVAGAAAITMSACPWRLFGSAAGDACVNCSYARVGKEAICPECGFAHDASARRRRAE